MGVLEELGIDAIGEVHIPQDDWHATALMMIDCRRQQVMSAQSRVKTERQQEALWAELRRLADLEFYVHSCQRIAAGDLSPEELARIERLRSRLQRKEAGQPSESRLVEGTSQYAMGIGVQ